MIRRIVAILLCLCITAIGLTGCQSDIGATFEDFSAPVDEKQSTSDVDATTTTVSSATSGDSSTTNPSGVATSTTTNKPGTTITTTATKKTDTTKTTATNKPGTTTTTKNPYLNPSVETVKNVNLAKGKSVKVDGKTVAAFTDENTTAAAFSGKNGQKATFELDLGKQCTFNEIWLYESTDNKVSDYSIYIQNNGKWVMIYKQDEISTYRACSFPAVTAQKIKLEVNATRDAYALTEMKVVNAGSRKDNDFRVFSYVTGWNEVTYYGAEGMPEHFDVTTDFIYIGDAKWDKDCNMHFTSAVTSEEEFAEKVANFKAAIKASGKDIRLWCTVGDPGEHTPKTFTGENQKKLIKNLVAFAQKYGFAGLDFDWEYPYTAANWLLYSDFLVNLKKELSKNGIMLSAAIAPWGFDMSKEAIDSLDYGHIMVYDLIDQTGNHASYDKALVSLDYFLNFGFERDRLTLGLAFYAKQGINPTGYRQMVARGAGHWDNHLEGTDIYFNGCQMIRDKTVLAIHEKLAGVMVWEFAGDVEESATGLSLYEEVRQARKQYLY